MNDADKYAGNIVLLRGACLWLLTALLLAWCLVGMGLGVPAVTAVFKDFTRLLQGHIDFLLMSALIFGIYAAKVPLSWHVRWSMVVGAFTNSSLFLLMSIFPVMLDAKAQDFAPEGLFPMLFRLYLFASLCITTYGFGMGSITIFRSTFATADPR